MTTLTERLTRASRAQFQNPHEAFDWPEALATDVWQMSPELCSLHGLPAFEQLADDARRALAAAELANFFSLNIHGEKHLMAGVAERLFGGRHNDVSDYLQHILDEENKHLFYFARFCRRYGCIYPERLVAGAETARAPEVDDVVFFARVLVFEELVDTFNQHMAADTRLAPICREINRAHHCDEARHLAFGRSYLGHLVEQVDWTEAMRAEVRDALGAYLASIRRDLCNPAVYRAVGLAEPYELARTARASLAERSALVAAAPAFLESLDLIAPEGAPTRHGGRAHAH